MYLNHNSKLKYLIHRNALQGPKNKWVIRCSQVVSIIHRQKKK